jgi:hypothetical protein
LIISALIDSWYGRCTFTPLGTATGAVYVRSHNGLQLAVKITGATGRTRLLRYVPRTREWVGSF